jgi:hypothetical protein
VFIRPQPSASGCRDVDESHVKTVGWWTGARLARSPASPSLASEAAEGARFLWRKLDVAGPVDCALALGWSVQERRLDAAAGGLQALLIARRQGGFAMVIDPDHTPQQRAQGLSHGEVTSWRAAHEYAHSFFFEGTTVPTRSRRANQAEERFCDEFASLITGVITMSCSEATGGGSTRTVA